MLTYKMAFVSPVWTPRVVARVVRDVLAAQRLTKVDSIRLIAAANRDLSDVLAGIQGIRTTTDLDACEIYRLYIDNSVVRQPNDPEPETLLPQGVHDYEIIDVVGQPRPRPLVVEKDPYGGAYLPDRFQRIPSTYDAMRNAPKPQVNDEPEWQPWL